MGPTDDTRLSHAPDQADPPENCPSDFRLARATGVFSAVRLPVKLPVNLAREQGLVTPSYPQLFEKTLEKPLKSADNCPVGKKREAGHYSGLNEN